jgi:hypothetical protein
MTRRKIPQKHRVFVGCEGASEIGYVTFLNGLFPHCHFDTLDLGEAGDIFECIKESTKYINNCRIKREPYERRFIFLDSDTIGSQHDQQRAEQLATYNNIDIIWQDPCHEALLLRHFDGQQNSQPPDCASAERNLRRHWPDYEKGLASQKIRKKLTKEHVIRAARAEPHLNRFLIANSFEAG